MQQILFVLSAIVSAYAANAQDPQPRAVRQLAAGWTARLDLSRFHLSRLRSAARFEPSQDLDHQGRPLFRMAGGEGMGVWDLRPNVRLFYSTPHRCWLESVGSDSVEDGSVWALVSFAIEPRQAKFTTYPDGDLDCRTFRKPCEAQPPSAMLASILRLRPAANSVSAEGAAAELNIACFGPAVEFPELSRFSIDFPIRFQGPGRGPASTEQPLRAAEGLRLKIAGPGENGGPAEGFVRRRTRGAFAFVRLGEADREFPSNDGRRTFRASPQCWMIASENPRKGQTWAFNPEQSALEARLVTVYEKWRVGCRAEHRDKFGLCPEPSAEARASIGTLVQSWAFDGEDGDQLTIRCIVPNPRLAPSREQLAKDFGVEFEGTAPPPPPAGVASTPPAI